MGEQAESVFAQSARRVAALGDLTPLTELNALRAARQAGIKWSEAQVAAYETVQYGAPAAILGLGTILTAENSLTTAFASVTYFGNQGGSDVHMHVFEGSQFTEYSDPEFHGTPYYGTVVPCMPGPCGDIRESTHTFPYSHSLECDYRVNADQSAQAYWTVPTTGVNWGFAYSGRHVPDKFGPACGSGGSGGGGGLDCHTEFIIIEIDRGNGWEVWWQGYATVCE